MVPVSTSNSSGSVTGGGAVAGGGAPDMDRAVQGDLASIDRFFRENGFTAPPPVQQGR
jgi:hypothetical protein